MSAQDDGLRLLPTLTVDRCCEQASYEFTCANHTQKDDCFGDDDCYWNTTVGKPHCGEFSCANLTTPAGCHNHSDSECSYGRPRHLLRGR